MRAYKSLAVVERAFRSVKTVDLHVRPIGHHWRNAYARMSSSACWPIMSSGTAPRPLPARETTKQREAQRAREHQLSAPRPSESTTKRTERQPVQVQTVLQMATVTKTNRSARAHGDHLSATPTRQQRPDHSSPPQRSRTDRQRVSSNKHQSGVNCKTIWTKVSVSKISK